MSKEMKAPPKPMRKEKPKSAEGLRPLAVR